MRLGFILLFVLGSLVSYSQEIKPDSLNPDAEYGYLLLDTTPIPNRLVYKPIIGLGMGCFTYKGDVRDNYNSHPWVGRDAVFFNVSRNLSGFFTANFNVTYGQMSGMQIANAQNLNFKTQILIGGITVSYNFRNFYKTQMPFNPYINLGLESFEFNSKADIYDAMGRKYYWWSDGTIRDRVESEANEMSSVLLQRDYKYETDLREMNLDGLGKYPQVAFGVPIDLGVEFRVHSRVTLKTGVTYHMTINDNVDNFTSKGEGERKGNSKGDNFWFTYITIHWDLFSQPPMTIYDRHYLEVDFNAIDMEDEDGDGVVDLWDEDAKTPSGVKVDNKGRPIDTDKDGIPDYRDKEIESAKGAIVDLDGVTMTEESQIAMSEYKASVPSDKLCEIYPSMCDEEGPKKFSTTYLELPAKFTAVDKNKDGYVSVEELNSAIDSFFDFSSSFTIDDLYELTDFFFEQ